MRPLALLVCLLLSTVCAAHADTVFHYLSESGDTIGLGDVQAGTITPDTGYSFTVQNNNDNNSVDFSADQNDPGAGGSAHYEVALVAPSGSALTVGDYPGAVASTVVNAGDERPRIVITLGDSVFTDAVGQF